MTLTEGAYEVIHIDAIVQKKVPNESIKLVVYKGSAKCKNFLKQGYKIDFTRNDTFRELLGFDAVIVDQPFTESPKICDLVISTNIYINLDIAKGSIFQKKSTDIVYSFPNNRAFKHLINLNIRQKREHLLVKKYF